MVAVTSAFSCVKRAIRAKQAKCFETPRAGIGPGADGGRSRLSGRLGNGRKEWRMRTSAPQFVACEELVWIKADGSETEVSARVGAPYPDGDGAFFCPVELSGVDGRSQTLADQVRCRHSALQFGYSRLDSGICSEMASESSMRPIAPSNGTSNRRTPRLECRPEPLSRVPARSCRP
jgi:hypothetical protein